MKVIQVNQWGSALGLRLPKFICERFGIDKNTTLSIREENHRIILEPLEEEKNLLQMLEEITPQNLHGETMTGRPLGNESW